ncbi:hypothetical protein CR513_42009, partial [Mucuna pruriens]
MEFGESLVQFNIYDAMKHPMKDYSLFSIDIIDELVEEYMQLGISSAEFSNFVEIPSVMDCFNFVENVFDFVNISFEVCLPGRPLTLPSYNSLQPPLRARGEVFERLEEA